MIITDGTIADYFDSVKAVKRKNRLHPRVEERLSYLLAKAYPDAFSVSEVAGILGGRNDVMQFFFNGRRVVFELFFSPSQVPQDLRLLEQSAAEVKIAILLDSEINPKLATSYFRKKPDHFPYLWLHQIMLPKHEAYCCARLMELIDENAAIVQLRNLLSSPAGGQIEEVVRKQLEQIERSLGTRQLKSLSRSENLTAIQIISLKVISQIKQLGVELSRLKALYVWLQDSIEPAVSMVMAGFQTFLVTDLDGRHAIWSDGDLADDIILGANQNDKAQIVICLNKTINDFWKALGYDPYPVNWHFFHNYAENKLIVIPPVGGFDKTEEE